MKQLIAITILLSGVFTGVKSQSLEQQFIELYHKKDTAGEKKILVQWQAKSPNDPELFVAYFNYHVQKSVLQDPALGAKSTSGSSTQQNGLAAANLKKAFEYIDKGIAMYPNRLDMRFGKIYMLGQKENYTEFTNEIIKTVDYSSVIKNAWLWTNNKPPKDPKQYMLSSVQEYILQLANTGNTKMVEQMKVISETVLKYYPDNVESLLDLSIVYTINKDYDKALAQLLKAEKLAPTNAVIMNGIAEAYRKKGDNAKAITYYEKVAKYGDDVAKADAKKKMEELKKK